ncbi:MAG: peroxin [Sclerophora amabilis]|nr:MAG: peroxin [Sclerophora amabilis]
MITATRNWFRRNRTNFAVGFGVLGVGYVATQYVLSKLAEARESMSSDRIARENLRRRFEQNQEDCTFTVLALLPTATENVLEALPVESITHELQQKKAERLARSNGSNEVTASEMSSGPPSVTDDDGRSLQSFQSESYVHASQMAENSAGIGEAGAGHATRPRKSKAQLWNDVKIDSITRSFTLIYTLSLLTLLTRIQLNLLGRRNYLSSVISLASPTPADSTISLEDHDNANDNQTYGNDFETNRRYLTFSWWLLHRGWREVMLKVDAAVREIFGSLNPRDDITMARMSELTIEVRKRVEGTTDAERKSHKWLPYLLPPPSEELFVLRESGVAVSPPATSDQTSTTMNPPEEISTLLRRLLDETSDLVDSPTFATLLTRLLDAGFSILIDTKLAPQASMKTNKSSTSTKDPQNPSPLSNTTTATSLHNPPNADAAASVSVSANTTLPPLDARIQEVQATNHPSPATKMKVATILAVLTRQAHAIGNGLPNEYLQAMETVQELGAFAAVVYSSNFEIEAHEGEGEGKGEGEKATAAAAAHLPSSGSENISSGDGSPSAESQSVLEGEASSLVDVTRPPLSGVAAAGEGEEKGEKEENVGFESAWGKATTNTTTTVPTAS